VRGVNFDTDRETWIADFVPHEMATIANDLHANSVLTPDAPHIPEYPQFDYDKASFALVKCHPEGPRESYASTGFFEPRLAFDVGAGRFGGA
jgi:hypothetical protein